MKVVDVIVILIIALIILFFIKNHYGEVEYVKSSEDDRYYLVRKLPDSQKAANYLARMNKKLAFLARHMIAKFEKSKDAQRLYENYNPDAISEGSASTGYTSYSVNKGEKIVLCIRQDNQDFVDENVVLYVAIHELAHIMTKEIGHTETFSRNFKFLLEEAIALGLYKKIDFNKHPQNYCGIKITSSII